MNPKAQNPNSGRGPLICAGILRALLDVDGNELELRGAEALCKGGE